MTETTSAEAEITTPYLDVQSERANIVTKVTSVALIIGGVACAFDVLTDYIKDSSAVTSAYLAATLTASGVSLFAINRRCNTMRADERS